MMEQENLPDEEMSIIRTPAQKPQGYTSTRLIKELSFKADITAVQSKAVLDALVEIAYREASRNCFVLPGLCKFELVRRKARRFRNPVTGEPLVLPERDALTVKLSKRAKEATVPHVTPLTPAEYEAYLVKKAAEEEAAHKAAEEERRAHEGFVEAPQVKGDRAISFKCVTCGQEIIAPEETIGYEAECPTCGAILVVPAQSQPGTMYAKDATAAAKKEVISVEQAENLNPSALKNRTIRIDSLTFLEESAEQEKLNHDARMKRAILSTTMRFDLPDEF